MVKKNFYKDVESRRYESSLQHKLSWDLCLFLLFIITCFFNYPPLNQPNQETKYEMDDGITKLTQQPGCCKVKRRLGNHVRDD